MDPQKIKTIRDFSALPILSKKNYTETYPLEERCWDGHLDRSKLIAVSSGTTGEPTFWPRGESQEFMSSVMHELIYRDLFEIGKKRTLLLIGFPMGIYVSGVATLLPSWLVSSKLKNLTIASVGNNKQEMLRIIKELGPSFDQIVLAGHPFFIKDVIESKGKISFGKMGLKMMLCSEGFTEEWREYLLSLTSAKKAGASDVISTYGSSEFLLMACESPLTIAFRKKISSDPELLKDFFPRTG